MRPTPQTTRPSRPTFRGAGGGTRRRAVSALGALLAVVGLLATSACATAGARRPDRPEAAWNEARAAMRGGAFARAEDGFVALAGEHPERPEGREALYLLGVLYLDPRNPAWDPERAEGHLGSYLRLDGPQDHRPEALALFALARRLVEPPERAAEESPREVVVEDVGADVGREERPSTDASAAENGRLQQQLAEKDREIARLREELERIRRTLSPP